MAAFSGGIAYAPGPMRNTSRTMSRTRRLLGGAREVLGGVAHKLQSPDWWEAVRAELDMMPKAALRTLPWLLRARDDRDESLLAVALHNAEEAPTELAFEMHDRRLT